VNAKNSYQATCVTNSQRWRINANWSKGQWVVNSRQNIDDGYYHITGYPSVNVASCSGYLARVYPSWFASQWVYGSIEVKNIGYLVYNRIVYKSDKSAWQGVVRTTHGIKNSHTLISWDEVKTIR